jgi:hypothetical protein
LALKAFPPAASRLPKSSSTLVICEFKLGPEIFDSSFFFFLLVLEDFCEEEEEEEEEEEVEDGEGEGRR